MWSNLPPSAQDSCWKFRVKVMSSTVGRYMQPPMMVGCRAEEDLLTSPPRIRLVTWRLFFAALQHVGTASVALRSLPKLVAGVGVEPTTSGL